MKLSPLKPYLFIALICSLLVIGYSGCQRKDPKYLFKETTLFTLMESSGLDFTPQKDDKVVFYGGAGSVDFDKDGLDDLLFVTEKEVKLYKNIGSLNFIDITSIAGLDLVNKGVSVHGFSIADVNGDYFPDIFFCQNRVRLTDTTNNVYDTLNNSILFINKGDFTFEVQSQQFGLSIPLMYGMSNFFDYDNDGDLDLVVTSWPHGFDQNGNGLFSDVIERNIFSLAYFKSNPAYKHVGVRLFENKKNFFVDVSTAAGIPRLICHTNSITTSDINGDGLMDIYIANDFLQKDLLLINNGDKSFTEATKKYLGKSAFYTMGADIADIDNDGWLDLVAVDMLPRDPYRQKLNLMPFSLDFYNNYSEIGLGQYQRNMVYKNNAGESFSEIGLMTNLYATEWSWSPLLADFDNDGLNDLIITNGSRYDWSNLDFLKGLWGKDAMSNIPTYNSSKKPETVPSYLASNFAFKNMGGLSFSDVTEKWGMNLPVNSAGSCYADFDNDGDLDLVILNFDSKPSLYKNLSIENGSGHYIQINLVGDGLNTNSIGAKIYAYSGTEKLVREIISSRGFMSVSDFTIHFGLKNNDDLDSLSVHWPDGNRSVFYDLGVDTTYVINEQKCSKSKAINSLGTPATPMHPHEKLLPTFNHQEANYLDYKRDKLLHRLYSREGPCVAVGDVNGDQLEDFYVGGAKGQCGALYLQNSQGFNLSDQPALYAQTEHEETDAVFLDVDQDGDNDLIIVSGSNEFSQEQSIINCRLFTNNGAGKFSYDPAGTPLIRDFIGTIAAGDFDNDGDKDLFLGGRMVPGNYPLIPKSYLLENRKGKFVEVTSTMASGLANAGVITSAIWTDYDKDNDLDLILTGEWMGVKIFDNAAGQLTASKQNLGFEAYKGWWNCIESIDLDKDGDLDFVVGNNGLNSIFQASSNTPVSLLYKDFDGNGTIDPVVFRYNEGENVPFVNRDVFCEAMPAMNNLYYNYESFAQANFKTLFTTKQKEGATLVEANELRSGCFMNDGNKFNFIPFPILAQTSPINHILLHDVNQDGITDLVLGGNTNSSYFEQGESDALKGLILYGTGKRDKLFRAAEFAETGFRADGVVNDLAKLYHKGLNKTILVVGNNNAPIQLYELNP
jgi:hypothetical protein